MIRLSEGVQRRIGAWLQRERIEVIVTNIGLVQNSVTPEINEPYEPSPVPLHSPGRSSLQIII